MNKKIKVRAWDRARGEMYYPSMLSRLGNESVPITSVRFTGDSPSDSILMLYSGLEDKNGKEIYDGDIYLAPAGKTLYVIQYINGAFCGGKLKYLGNPEKFGPIGWTTDIEDVEEHIISDFHLEITIVGNIFENPELLEQCQKK